MSITYLDQQGLYKQPPPQVQHRPLGSKQHDAAQRDKGPRSLEGGCMRQVRGGQHVPVREARGLCYLLICAKLCPLVFYIRSGSLSGPTLEAFETDQLRLS